VPVPFDAGWGRDRGRLRELAAATGAAAEPVLGLLALARALREAGDDGAAEGLLRAALRARPQEVVLHHALGQLLAGQRRWPEAAECCVAARALRPELGVALARALVSGSRVKEGLALFERLRVERGDNPWVAFAHGNALLGQRRPLEAESAFRTAFRLRHNYFEAHNSLGNALNAQRRFEDAEAAYRAAIRLRPDHPMPRLNLGNALGGQRRYEEAEAAYRAALRLEPDFPGAHFNLGNALNGQGLRPEAESAYRAALRLRPADAEGHNNLGNALSGQRRYREAESAYRTALRLRPDLPGRTTTSDSP
jgi:tetratricopeptide (TPR) repeat protein